MELTLSALSARTASLIVFPVFWSSKTFLASDGNVIVGRSVALEAEGLGDADAEPSVSAPAILSLPLLLSSPPPQAVRSRAAAAASAVAAGKVRRFTVLDSP